MSIMIVSNSTFQKVANTLFTPRQLRVQHFLESYAERNRVPYRWNLITQELEKLREAQYLSYEQLYKEKRECPPINYSETRESYKSLVELLKALECIHYQIELKDFDDSFVLALIRVIKDAIIENLPEYQDAHWG
ncbi:hypothetical protein [Brevibacillus agri]|uniref:hypothetical protein n=1 Tax=Brevibacillus agri TaxID=51101 RepID=UPI0018CD0D5C|nr:hypothetical protein [Brevibacillus agri]MBG9568416.1 hypothetical protein [Brevibacillus agri]